MFKQIILILIFISSIVFAQDLYLNEAFDFKINEDNSSSNIIQNNASLYPYFNNGFVVVWEDYRDGIGKYYAQVFDSAGNKIQNNIEFYGDEVIKIDNDYVVITYDIFDAYGSHLEASYSKSGLMINRYNSQEIKLFFGFLGAIVGESETIKNRMLCVPSSNGLIVFKNYYESIEIVRYDKLGNETNIGSTIYLNRIASSIITSGQSLADGCYIYTYLGIDEKNVPGIYAVFFDSSNQVISKDVLIQNVNSWDAEFFIESVSDSVYAIFVYDVIANKLFSDQILSNGEKISRQVIELINNDGNEYSEIYNFSKIKNKDNSISIIISLKGVGQYYTWQVNFDEFGQLINTEEIGASSYVPKFDKELVQTVNKQSFYSRNINNDIFISDYFDSANVTIQVNDDEVGSNEINPKVINAGNENFLVMYESGIEKIGKFVDGLGNIKKTVVLNPDENLYFLSDGTLLKVWDNNLNPDSLSLAYTIEDVFGKTIVYETINNLKTSDFDIITTTDSCFILACQSNDAYMVRKIDKYGEILIEEYIPEYKGYQYNNLYYANEDYFWISAGGHYPQKYSLELERQSDVIHQHISYYLSDNVFIEVKDYSYNDDVGPYAYWFYNFSDDLAPEKIAEIESDSYFKWNNIDNKTFCGSFVSWTNIVNNIYHKSDYSFYKKLFIHDAVDSRKLNPSFAISGTKAMFVWQDNRNKGLGYDIYGSIFDLDEITDVYENESADNLPKEFQLEQNYPNPFNPVTTINYTIPVVETWQLARPLAGALSLRTTLKIYDVLGNEIKTLVNEQQSPGKYSVKLDGSNLASGVYYYRLSYRSNSVTRKMILLK